MKHHLEYYTLAWGPQVRKDVKLLERIQRKLTVIIRGLEQLSYEDRLRELGLFCLEKFQGDLNYNLSIFKGSYKKEGNQLFTRIESDMTRGNGFKLQKKRFRLDVKGIFFTETEVKC